MKVVIGWLMLICLGGLTLFQGLMLGLGQFAHDFTTGGYEPIGLKYGLLMLVLKILALGVSRRTGLPLLLVGVADWLCGIVFFQMYSQHLQFGAALWNSWLDASFIMFAAIYAATIDRTRREQRKANDE